MTENRPEAVAQGKTLESAKEPAQKKRRGRLPQETLDAIRERLRAGSTQAQVAREFGLASSTIARHVKGWPEVRFQPIDSFKYPIRER